MYDLDKWLKDLTFGIFSDICNKGFGAKSSLVSHMSTHAITKPFSCNICGKTFALKVTRDSHLAQHTGMISITLLIVFLLIIQGISTVCPYCCSIV